MGWPELMDRIKMMVLSIWSIPGFNIGKGQAGITRTGCVKDLDPKIQQRGSVMLDVFGVPSTPTIGKEAFLGGPAYLFKTDLDTPVSRKKEIELTMDQGTHQWQRLYDPGLVSLLVETLVLDPQLGGH
jgi:hypothetical protein